MINKFKFIFLSLAGFIFFLVPFTIGGEQRIMISHMIYFVEGYILDEFMIFTLICAWLVLVGTVVFMIYTSENDFLNSVFKASPINVVLRIVGSLLYLMVMYNWFENIPGAHMILDADTGGLMAGPDGLLTTLYITFFVGLLALPLLTHFGIVEFIGILLGPVVEKVFRVPGYSTIDAIASFVGDGTIGIVVTDKQYQRGYYNKREAYIISTSFSIVGIAFAAAVAQELGFNAIFPIFYGSILLVTIVLAFITARLPLKKFPETYYEDKTPKETTIPENHSLFSYAYESAIKQSASTKVSDAIKEAFKNIVDIFVGFLPVIMAIGTISLIIAEYTAFFTIISTPLVYVYEVLGFSREVALDMAPASVAGFADMYLPALFISGAESEAARFFIGVLAFTQLVFMSETGMILVKTKIGLNFLDVVKVFVFRTLVSLPILIVVTYVLAAMGVIAF